jgi:putative oxygen-independent coproporphyrinogen III oxidase
VTERVYQGLRGNRAPGLYIHVPFCKTKCPYCDFYSVTDLSLIESWLHAVKREMALYRGMFGAFSSLYLGGGTPTVLTGPNLEVLLGDVRRSFTFAPDTEITIEANPDDITRGKLIHFRSLGINRISVGIQSFRDRELRLLGRRHTALKAKRSMDLARAAGFTNVGMDLMYGLPGQTEDAWLQTLERGLFFTPAHLSCYQLTTEQGTPFARMKAEGRITPLGEDKERSLFVLTSRHLRSHGFIHYEVSNFARNTRYISRHNAKYWLRVNYLGLGPSAHSFKDGVRWWNCRSLEAYSRVLETGERPVEGSEILSQDQVRLEHLYLGLRTKFGVTIEHAFNGIPSSESLRRLRESRLVSIRGRRIISTQKGLLVADRLPLMFFD